MQELRDLEAGSTVGRPPAGGWRGGWRPRTETSERYAEPKVRYGEPYAHRASRRAAKQPSPVARAVGLAAAVVVAAAAVRAAADERARQNALGEWRRREEERGKMRAEKPLHGKHRRRDKVRKRKGGTPDSEGG